MNIFYLDADITQCARYHCDKHVVKMILESAQMLCAVLWLNGIEAPYKPTHVKHPCVIWANSSLSNWKWLKALGGALNEEYKYRFNHTKNHRAFDVISTLKLPPIPDIGLTEHAQAIPDELKQKDPIQAYRKFYMTHKKHLAHWSKRDKPEWFIL